MKSPLTMATITIVRLSAVLITTTFMLCGFGLAQEANKQTGRAEPAYLFCGENSKRSVSVFAHPCEREPLKIGACGSSVQVIEQDGDWLKLTFEDKDQGFVRTAEVSKSSEHFEALHPAKQSPGYTTPECVAYVMAKAKGQPPPARIKPPRPIFTPDPKYPPNAKRIDGTVDAWCTVGADGRVHSVDVVKSLGSDFDAAAIAALKRWRFEPANRDGKPIETKVNISMHFWQVR